MYNLEINFKVVYKADDLNKVLKEAENRLGQLATWQRRKLLGFGLNVDGQTMAINKPIEAYM